jgi:hypothetical protein
MSVSVVNAINVWEYAVHAGKIKFLDRGVTECEFCGRVYDLPIGIDQQSDTGTANRT